MVAVGAVEHRGQPIDELGLGHPPVAVRDQLESLK